MIISGTLADVKCLVFLAPEINQNLAAFPWSASSTSGVGLNAELLLVVGHS